MLAYLKKISDFSSDKEEPNLFFCHVFHVLLVYDKDKVNNGNPFLQLSLAFLAF